MNDRPRHRTALTRLRIDSDARRDEGKAWHSRLFRNAGCVEKAVLSIAAAMRSPSRVVWHGPIGRARKHALPWLSWFEHEATEDRVPQSFVETLNRIFDDATNDFPPDIDDLIRRVGATWIPLGTPDPSLETARATQVIIVDERHRPQDPACDSPVSRPSAFKHMVAAARDQHPGVELTLIRSDDCASGQWLSESIGAIPADTRLRHVVDLSGFRFDSTTHVYTIGASEGLLALLAGALVHVFGGPYYAGWGLTVDYFPSVGRRHRPTVHQLFHAVFLRLAHYLDPHPPTPGDIRSVLALLELQREVATRFADMRHLAAIRIQRWKRLFVAPFLTAGGGTLRWTKRFESRNGLEHAVLWGARGHAPLPQTAKCIRIEDGFLHSLGLGSDIVAPCSLVIDTRGIYFDPGTPNDLTEILNGASFDEAELARASKLRERIVRSGITKYNLGRRAPRWTAPQGRDVVLVTGQVEDDASIRLGCPEIRTARALLTEVRARRPHAWLVYRPHPDVLARNRRGLVDASEIADIVDVESDVVSLIEIADEVHTLTSLAGFDALLRGKAVFTYGMPFYAGWGLTHDAIAAIPYRKQTLSLDMITAGVLLRYPVYWDWRLRLFTSPEAIVDHLACNASRPLKTRRWPSLRWLKRIRRWAWNTCTSF